MPGDCDLEPYLNEAHTRQWITSGQDRKRSRWIMTHPFDQYGPTGRAGIRRSGFVAAAAIISLVGLFSSWFVVAPANVAFTRWLGGTVMQRQPLGPGLHLKIPFMETVDEIQ